MEKQDMMVVHMETKDSNVEYQGLLEDAGMYGCS
jgi:hypothetical protein